MIFSLDGGKLWRGQAAYKDVSWQTNFSYQHEKLFSENLHNRALENLHQLQPEGRSFFLLIDLLAILRKNLNLTMLRCSLKNFRMCTPGPNSDEPLTPLDRTSCIKLIVMTLNLGPFV